MHDNIRVLVIEDDRDLLNQLVNCYKKIFIEENIHCSITKCNVGAFALSMVEEEEEKFDLVSLDMNLGIGAPYDKNGKFMKGSDGRSILTTLSENQSCNGVIIVSGIQHDEELEWIDHSQGDLEVFRRTIHQRLEELYPNKNAIFYKSRTDFQDTISDIFDSKDVIIKISGINDEPEYGWIQREDFFDIYFFNQQTQIQERLHLKKTNAAIFIQKLLKQPYPQNPIPESELYIPLKINVDDAYIEMDNDPFGYDDGKDKEVARVIDYSEEVSFDDVKSLIMNIENILKKCGPVDKVSSPELLETLEFLVQDFDELYQMYKSGYNFKVSNDNKYKSHKYVLQPELIYVDRIQVTIKILELKLKKLTEENLSSIEDYTYDPDLDLNKYTILMNLVTLYSRNPKFTNDNIMSYAMDQISELEDRFNTNDVQFDAYKLPTTRKISFDKKPSRSNVSNQIKNFIFKLEEKQSQKAPGLIEHLKKSFGCQIEFNPKRNRDERKIKNPREYKPPKDQIVRWRTK